MAGCAKPIATEQASRAAMGFQALNPIQPGPKSIGPNYLAQITWPKNRDTPMADRPATFLICSCEDTMPLDREAVTRGCRGAEVLTARQLCRAELERFRAATAAGGPLIVGCTQEAPL